MQINETTLREHYATLSSEQLLELYGRGTLTAQAMQVLGAVLDERGVPRAERAQVAAAGQERIAAVERELQLRESLRASWGSRLIARLIDLAIVVTGSMVAAIAGPGVVAALLFVPCLLYFMFADALPNGQSLGKRLMGIAVVDMESLEPCTPLQAIQRNWVMSEAFGWLLKLVLLVARGPGFRGPTMVVWRRSLVRLRRR